MDSLSSMDAGERIEPGMLMLFIGIPPSLWDRGSDVFAVCTAAE